MKKQHSRRTSFLKLMAVVLATLMLATALPMTVLAAPTGYEDGDLILKVGSMSANSVSYNPYNAKVTPPIANAKAKLDSNDAKRILCNSSTDPFGGVGFVTDLPLNGDTAYTIEYYVKPLNLDSDMSIYFGFCHNTSYPNYGMDVLVNASGNTLNTHNKWFVNGYYKEGSTTDYGGRGLGCNVWEDKADADGFVRFVMTFDGQFLSISIDGEDIGVRYDLDRPRNTNFKKVDDWEVKTLCIQAGYTDKGATAITQPKTNDPMFELKDISIYAGVVDLEKVEVPQFVTFENDKGTVLSEELITDGSLTLTSFPEVKSTNTIVWVNKETGKIVEAPTAEKPLTVTEATTLVYYERRTNDSVLLDVQYSTVENGKQDIRFLGGVYNTKCKGVGFEITARYKNTSGEIVEMFYRKSGTAVFDSIKATENGTMKNSTAYDLGAYYVYGFVLEDVPTDLGQIDFVIKTFKVIGDLGLRIYSQAQTVSFKDGVINTDLTPLT